MDFHSMKRKELQALCKKHKIPANLTNLEMANNLASLLKEREKPMTRGRTCLKNSDVVSEIDSNGITRQSKKVRFSPEDELIEFVGSNVQHVKMKRGKSRMRAVVEKRGSVVDNVDSIDATREIAENPVRTTRSRAQKLFNEGVIPEVVPVVEKKRRRNGVKYGGRSESSLFVVDSSDNLVFECAAVEETGLPTRRSLRNRGVLGKKCKEVAVSRNNQTLRSSKKKNVKTSGKTSEDNGFAVNGGIIKPEKGLRRSNRNATKVQDYRLMDGYVPINEIDGSGRTRQSQTQFADSGAAAKGEKRTETEVEVQGKLEGVLQLEEPIRHRGRYGNRRQSVMPQIESAGTNGAKIENEDGKVEVVLQLEEPLRNRGRYGNRRRSVMPQIERAGTDGAKVENEDGKLEVILQLEEPLRRRGRYSNRRQSVMPQIERAGTDGAKVENENGKLEVVLQLEDPSRCMGSDDNRQQFVMARTEKGGIDEQVMVEKESAKLEVVLQLEEPSKCRGKNANKRQSFPEGESICQNPAENDVRSRRGSSIRELVAISDAMDRTLSNTRKNNKPSKRRRDPILEDALVTEGVSIVDEPPRRSTRNSAKADKATVTVRAGKAVQIKKLLSISELPNLEAEPLAECSSAVKEQPISMAEIAINKVLDSRNIPNNSTNKKRKESSEKSLAAETYPDTSDIEEAKYLKMMNSVEGPASKPAKLWNDCTEKETLSSVSGSEVDLTLHSCKRSRGFDSSNLIAAEPKKELNASTDGGVRQATSGDDGYSLTDQTDYVAKPSENLNLGQEMKRDEETVPCSVIDSDCVHGDKSPVHTDLKLLYLEDNDSFGEPNEPELVAAYHSVQSNESGDSKRNFETVNEEAREINVIDIYDSEKIRPTKVEDKEIGEPEKSALGAVRQESANCNSRLNIELELTQNVSAVSPLVTESERNPALNGCKKASEDTDIERKRCSRYSESRKHLLMEVCSENTGFNGITNLMMANLEGPPSSSSVELQSDSADQEPQIPASESLVDTEKENTELTSSNQNMFHDDTLSQIHSADFDCKTVVDLEQVEDQDKIGNVVVTETTTKAGSFSPVQQVDHVATLTGDLEIAKSVSNKYNQSKIQNIVEFQEVPGFGEPSMHESVCEDQSTGPDESECAWKNSENDSDDKAVDISAFTPSHGERKRNNSEAEFSNTSISDLVTAKVVLEKVGNFQIKTNYCSMGIRLTPLGTPESPASPVRDRASHSIGPSFSVVNDALEGNTNLAEVEGNSKYVHHGIISGTDSFASDTGDKVFSREKIEALAEMENELEGVLSIERAFHPVDKVTECPSHEGNTKLVEVAVNSNYDHGIICATDTFGSDTGDQICSREKIEALAEMENKPHQVLSIERTLHPADEVTGNDCLKRNSNCVGCFFPILDELSCQLTAKKENAGCGTNPVRSSEKIKEASMGKFTYGEGRLISVERDTQQDEDTPGLINAPESSLVTNNEMISSSEHTPLEDDNGSGPENELKIPFAMPTNTYHCEEAASIHEIEMDDERMLEASTISIVKNGRLDQGETQDVVGLAENEDENMVHKESAVVGSDGSAEFQFTGMNGSNYSTFERFISKDSGAGEGKETDDLYFHENTSKEGTNVQVCKLVGVGIDSTTKERDIDKSRYSKEAAEGNEFIAEEFHVVGADMDNQCSDATTHTAGAPEHQDPSPSDNDMSSSKLGLSGDNEMLDKGMKSTPNDFANVPVIQSAILTEAKDDGRSIGRNPDLDYSKLATGQENAEFLPEFGFWDPSDCKDLTSQVNGRSNASLAEIVSRESEDPAAKSMSELVKGTSKCTIVTNLLKEENGGTLEPHNQLGISKMLLDGGVELAVWNSHGPDASDKDAKEDLILDVTGADFDYKDCDSILMGGAKNIMLEHEEVEHRDSNIDAKLENCTAALVELRDRNGDGDLTETSNKFLGAAPQVDQVKLNDPTGHKTQMFQALGKGSFLTLHEFVPADCKQGEDETSFEAAGTKLQHKEMKLSDLDSHKNVGTTEGNLNIINDDSHAEDFNHCLDHEKALKRDSCSQLNGSDCVGLENESHVSQSQYSFGAGGKEVTEIDWVNQFDGHGTTIGGNGDRGSTVNKSLHEDKISSDTTDGSNVEENVESKETFVEEELVEDSMEEDALVGGIGSLALSKPLCDNEAENTVEEAIGVNGSLHNFNDMVHCAGDSNENAEKQNFSQSSTSKPTIGNDFAAAYCGTMGSGSPEPSKSNLLSSWEINLFLGDEVVKSISATSESTVILAEDQLGKHNLMEEKGSCFVPNEYNTGIDDILKQEPAVANKPSDCRYSKNEPVEVEKSKSVENALKSNSMDLDFDRGAASIESVEVKNPLANADVGKSAIKQLNSTTMKIKKARIQNSSIQATPKKVLTTVDMKENELSIKREHLGNRTITVKSTTKRRALEDLQMK